LHKFCINEHIAAVRFFGADHGEIMRDQFDGEADNRNIPAAKDKLIPGKSVEISLS
jgi:hypothetical protein